MTVLSNVEFEKVVTDQSSRLKMIAKQRCDKDPTGFLTFDDIGQYITACTYSGDKKSAQWLKSLVVIAKNGKLSRMRTNSTTWEDHVEEVHRMSATGNILDIGQHVRCKESGRYGSIADYNPDSKEYIVILDPFQVMVYKNNQLEIVAKKKAQSESLIEDSNSVIVNIKDEIEYMGPATTRELDSVWLATRWNSSPEKVSNAIEELQRLGWLEVNEISDDGVFTVSRPWKPGETKWVNVYQISNHYGGSEEGGWWYDWYSLEKAIPVTSLKEAKEVQKKLEAEYGGENTGYNYPSDKADNAWVESPYEGEVPRSMEGQEIAIYIENEKGESETKERPHYE